jgi:hypothetical protein
MSHDGDADFGFAHTSCLLSWGVFLAVLLPRIVDECTA